MSDRIFRSAAALSACACMLGHAASAQDWSNLGGNAARNGLSGAVGPASPTVRWSNTDDPAAFAWLPVTLDGHVFAVRESALPALAANDAIVACDLATGEELWRTTVPYAGNPQQEWIAWIAGAANGRIYASRAGALRTTPVYAFDADTGALVWTSDEETRAGPHDGVVFAPDGDLLIGDYTRVLRLDGATGDTVWSVDRDCSVAGSCGVVTDGQSVYFDALGGGGQVIRKIDLETGAFICDGPPMPGFNSQNAPFLAPGGGIVYFARSQGDPSFDLLYAFADEGASLSLLWTHPVRWTTVHEHGIGPDGSVYTLLPDGSVARLDGLTGDVLGQTAPLSPLGSSSVSPRTAVDGAGAVYFSNGPIGATPAGRLWAFSADLSQTRFVLDFNQQNSGGPSIAPDGTLLIADRDGLHAYRDAEACIADWNGDLTVDSADFFAFIAAFIAGSADANADGTTDSTDFFVFIAMFITGGCA